jgi:hypothetical protein
VRFIHFGAKSTACWLAVVLAVTVGSTRANALSPSPQSAPQFNGSVYAIVFRAGTVYVGGSFTRVKAGTHMYARQRLAAFDARTGALLDWAPSADGTVRALATNGDDVYAAGGFNRVAGVRRDSLARIDAITGALEPFSHTISGTTYALSIGGDRLYLGGRFSTVDGSPRANLAAFALAGDALDSSWQPSTDGPVHAVAAYGSRVYLGGAFRAVNDVSGALRVAAVTAADGKVDQGFMPGPSAEVNALTADTTGVYAATGGQGGRAVAYTPLGGVRWQRVFDGDVAAIARLDGVTYVGGHFDSACVAPTNGPHGRCTGASVPRVKIAAINDGGTLATWAPQANGVIGVRALAVDPTRTAISIGGDFTTINGLNRLRYASFS